MLYIKKGLIGIKKIKNFDYIVVGVIALLVFSLIFTAVIGITEAIKSKDNQKECETNTTTIVQETTEEMITEKSTVKETANKVLTTKEIETEKATAEVTTKKEQFNYVNCDVPSNNTMKTYMDYRAITSTTSRQYKLQKTLAYTDDNGLRMVNGRYCVAVGSYYTTTIGQHIDIKLENGKIIKAVLADCKSDKHTDSTNRIHPDGSVVEFVVDTDTLNSTAKRMGDISYVNGWNSKIVNIKVYDTIEKF